MFPGKLAQMYIGANPLRTDNGAILDNYEKDVLTEYLEQIKKTVAFEHWFYGHYHKDRTIYNIFTCVCDAVIELPE